MPRTITFLAIPGMESQEHEIGYILTGRNCYLPHYTWYTIQLIGRNGHLPHCTLLYTYVFTYWQELSSAPLHNTHFILIGRNDSLPPSHSYTLINTYWQERSSAPICIYPNYKTAIVSPILSEQGTWLRT